MDGQTHKLPHLTQCTRCLGLLFLVVAAMVLSGCGTLMSKVTGGLANNLSEAMLNQDDPETVRDGAPAYLLMLDSLCVDHPTMVMKRTRELDPQYKASQVELYLAVLNTIRPPALGAGDRVLAGVNALAAELIVRRT